MNALLEQLTSHQERWWRYGAWWEDAARKAIAAGRFLLIPSRDRGHLYLARFWLCEAPRDEHGEIESGNCTLLHYFARPDDDGALHDHPWAFRTRLLFGGYTELLPAHPWSPGSALGPEAVDRVARTAGDTIDHAATDLHAVGAITVGTWTYVQTGPRERDWGFHPPGKPWVHFRTYLGEKTCVQPAAQRAVTAGG